MSYNTSSKSEPMPNKAIARYSWLKQTHFRTRNATSGLQPAIEFTEALPTSSFWLPFGCFCSKEGVDFHKSRIGILRRTFLNTLLLAKCIILFFLAPFYPNLSYDVLFLLLNICHDGEVSSSTLRLTILHNDPAANQDQSRV